MPQDRPDRLQSEVRTAVVVQTPELMNYDLDGNLVRDGRWVYTWDAENRLVRVMSWGSVDRRRVDWTYDAMGRRVRQVRYVWTNGTWQVVEDLKLVSDPVWFGRHIAELNGTNGAVVRSYVWGLDLSESLDGAGGVGGLLWVRLNTRPASGAHFVTYEGNGNVWNLVSATTGTETAWYEYGPFGEPLRMTGAAVGWNPFRFSTKRTEDGTGLVLYEYRAYSPALGRWLSRDPIKEKGAGICMGSSTTTPQALSTVLACCSVAVANATTLSPIAVLKGRSLSEGQSILASNYAVRQRKSLPHSIMYGWRVMDGVRGSTLLTIAVYSEGLAGSRTR
jgi:RHS repeat-associated protein